MRGLFEEAPTAVRMPTRMVRGRYVVREDSDCCLNAPGFPTVQHSTNRLTIRVPIDAAGGPDIEVQNVLYRKSTRTSNL